MSNSSGAYLGIDISAKSTAMSTRLTDASGVYPLLSEWNAEKISEEKLDLLISRELFNRDYTIYK